MSVVRGVPIKWVLFEGSAGTGYFSGIQIPPWKGVHACLESGLVNF